MSGPEVQAEIVKLARLLQREPQQLSYLEHLSAEDLRALREQITEALFTAHEGALRGLVAASKLLPVGLVASLGAVGPPPRSCTTAVQLHRRGAPSWCSRRVYEGFQRASIRLSEFRWTPRILAASLWLPLTRSMMRSTT